MLMMLIICQGDQLLFINMGWGKNILNKTIYVYFLFVFCLTCYSCYVLSSDLQYIAFIHLRSTVVINLGPVVQN